MSEVHCERCGALCPPAPPEGGATGYALTHEGERICYGCCAEDDRETMRHTGRITLYLNAHEVKNWPGTLRLPIIRRTEQRRAQFGLPRIEVWFMFEGQSWHGVHLGDDNTLVRCVRSARHRAS